MFAVSEEHLFGSSLVDLPSPAAAAPAGKGKEAPSNQIDSGPDVRGRDAAHLGEPKPLALIEDEEFQVGADPLQRREFLIASAAAMAWAIVGEPAAVDPELLVHGFIRPATIDQQVLDVLAQRLREYEQIYWTVRPDVLLPIVEGHLAGVRAIINGNPQPRVRGEAMRVASASASLAGSLAWRLDRRTDSAVYLALSLELAGEAEDAHLKAQTLVAMRALCSTVTADVKHANTERALALLNEAATHTDRGAPPLLRTEVLACRAEELAVLGRSPECLADLDAAEHTMSHACTPSDDFFSHWDDKRIGCYRGTCGVLLHQPNQAASVLEDVVRGTSPSLIAPYTAALADLAAARAQQAEVEQSCALLIEVLTIAAKAGMPQRIHRVRKTRSAFLNEWSASLPVRQLDDHLRQFVAADAR